MQFSNEQYIRLTNELHRVGARGLDFMSDFQGNASLADENGYYPLTHDYQECLELLSSYEGGAITDQVYDGDDRAIWQVIWDLIK